MSKKVKSAAGEVSVVTVDPRRPSTSEVSKRLQDLENRIRQKYRGLIVDQKSIVGQELQSRTEFLNSSPEDKVRLQELRKALGLKNYQCVLFHSINEDQLVNEPVHENHYRRGNYFGTGNSVLLYKLVKTEAKLVRSILEKQGFMYTDSHD